MLNQITFVSLICFYFVEFEFNWTLDFCLTIDENFHSVCSIIFSLRLLFQLRNGWKWKRLNLQWTRVAYMTKKTKSKWNKWWELARVREMHNFRSAENQNLYFILIQKTLQFQEISIWLKEYTIIHERRLWHMVNKRIFLTLIYHTKKKTTIFSFFLFSYVRSKSGKIIFIFLFFGRQKLSSCFVETNNRHDFQFSHWQQAKWSWIRFAEQQIRQR